MTVNPPKVVAVESTIQTDKENFVKTCGYNEQIDTLRIAISQGNVERVKQLLNNGVDLNVKENAKKAPLHTAIVCCDSPEEIVRMLLEKGASANDDINSAGDTPLTIAVRLQKLETLRCLLDRGAEVNKVGGLGVTPLCWAVITNNADAVHILVVHGADPKASNKDGTTALGLAYTLNKPEILSYFTNRRKRLSRYHVSSRNQGATVSKTKPAMRRGDINTLDCEGYTPLALAVKQQDFNLVQYLFNLGADICKVGKGGKTPLLLAVQLKNLQMVKVLIEHGAQLTLQTAFLEAVRIGDVDTINYFIDVGAIVNLTYKNGRTPLTMAIETGNFAVVKMLVESGADINMPDKERSLPLSIALEIGNLTIVKYLVTNGARFDEKCQFLSKYIEDNNVELVKLLIEAGADLHSIFECGCCPLTKAVSSDNFRMVMLLVEKGANVTQVDANNETALALAAASCNFPVVKFLLERGADMNSAQAEIDEYASWNEDFEIFLAIFRGELASRSTTIEGDLTDGGHDTAPIEVCHSLN